MQTNNARADVRVDVHTYPDVEIHLDAYGHVYLHGHAHAVLDVDVGVDASVQRYICRCLSTSLVMYVQCSCKPGCTSTC